LKKKKKKKKKNVKCRENYDACARFENRKQDNNRTQQDTTTGQNNRTRQQDTTTGHR
jgi:hypothetical protein